MCVVFVLLLHLAHDLSTQSIPGRGYIVQEMYPQSRHPAPHQPSQPFKFTVAESCDRIKEEFQFLQAQYHSLKMECDKLANEKTEMQRHYVMYYEMSYGLNIEMHKQMEIAKRLNTILAQIMPFLSQEHQQQVAQAVERAKQVTMTELNSIIGVRGVPNLPLTVCTPSYYLALSTSERCSRLVERMVVLSNVSQRWSLRNWPAVMLVKIIAQRYSVTPSIHLPVDR